MTTTLTPRRERWLLLTLAGVQFTHILDFMIMMPLGPQFTQIFGISNAQFGLLVSAYTLSAGLSGLLASMGVDLRRAHGRSHCGRYFRRGFVGALADRGGRCGAL